MSKKITRRSLLGSAAAIAAAAQTPPAPAQPDYAAASATANQRAIDAIGKVALPQSTEPAFAFKA